MGHSISANQFTSIRRRCNIKGQHQIYPYRNLTLKNDVVEANASTIKTCHPVYPSFVFMHVHIHAPGQVCVLFVLDVILLQQGRSDRTPKDQNTYRETTQ